MSELKPAKCCGLCVYKKYSYTLEKVVCSHNELKEAQEEHSALLVCAKFRAAPLFIDLSRKEER
jgi:hypothetical protein